MPTDYYFISDMHIGGDGALRDFDSMDELLSFLHELAQHEGAAELIINGDAFGLWEFTAVEGMEKLETLIHQQATLFQQFKATGARIPITLIAGNHDYELACYPAFIARLKEFNLNLVPEIAITREVAGQKIWIEHGMQYDANNRMPDFGNPYAQPLGYHITTRILGTAGKLSDFGKDNWLKDIQSVTELTDTPSWMSSNYFYREMSTTLRYLLLPFLLLFGVSILVFIAGLLEWLGVVNFNLITQNRFFQQLGVFGDFLLLVFTVNGVVLLFLLLLAVPLFFLIRDVRKTLWRYNILGRDDEEDLLGQDRGPYIAAARQLFEEHPDVSVFIFGHTHRVFLKTLADGRVVLNTGTWLKLLYKVPVLFGYLPPIYYPIFQISSFRITEEENQLVIYYRQIHKDAPRELTWLQRLLIFTRAKPQATPVPRRTMVDVNR